MRLRLVTLSFAALGVAACSGTTEPKTPTVSLTGVPDLGPTMTIAGQMSMGNTGVAGLGGALSGNPYAIAAAQSGTATPPPPVCAPVTAQGTVSCTAAFNGLNFAYTLGFRDTLGMRSESTISGTIPASGAVPARRVNRTATTWTERPPEDFISLALKLRIRSTETGTIEVLGTTPSVAVDTGSADIRLYLRGPSPSDLRMVGTSRRIVWTRTTGGPATFWRETTTYDSTTVIRSVIETPGGTKRCSIDLAGPSFVTTCN